MSVPFHISENILFEDTHILIINKPAGLMVEPDRNRNPNLLSEVKKYLASKTETKDVYAQHLHRLDRPVSGIVLFTKQKEVLRNLSEQFAERKVKKTYLALTNNTPERWEGTLEHWHRKEKKKAVLYIEEVQWSEKAKLAYQVKELKKDLFVWEIDLQTGKYHQIRAQLASVGCPIIGDSVYGSKALFKKDTIALHANRLIFNHPVYKEAIEIISQPDFYNF